MTKKFTYTFIKNYIELDGSKLLSYNYDNIKKKLDIKCPYGHIYNKSFHHFYYQNQRCPICSKNKKTNIIKNERWCGHCKTWKPLYNFSWLDKKRNLYQSICKECVKKYNKNHYKNNKNLIMNNNSSYYYKNIEKSRNIRKDYWNKNKDKIKPKSKQYNNSPIKYNSKAKYRKEIELYEEVKESSNGNLMCKCAYCGEWFEPTVLQVVNRIKSINGKMGRGGSESRLYCSQSCKRNCPIFRQVKYPKDQKPATSREVQPELRQMVFERDNYTCQKCNNHRDELEVGIHCHHKEGILWEPLQSADIDMCITLCEDCHKEVHDIDGCGYNEMRCT